MKMKKLLGTGLALILTTAMLAGCGGNSAQTTGDAGVEETAGTSAATVETATDDEIVTLKWYMALNPIAADTDKVIAKLNEYTREKIGVEIDYTVIAKPDYKEKMSTLINSGEYFDICFTSFASLNYAQFAGRGAFLDIAQMLPQYAKETYDFVPQELWKAVTINGKTYGIPTYKEMGWQTGFFVNSDMADEYGIDLNTVKTLEDYTAVLQTVKELSLIHI